VKLEHYFVDGIRIEPNANRNTFVWGKAVVKQKAKLPPLKSPSARKNRIMAGEIFGTRRDCADHRREAGRSRQATGGRAPRETQGQAAEESGSDATQRHPPTPAKYETQQEILGERNSFSKTDRDETFMRMKKDHMRNGQLKPGYNVQIGTEIQFIVGYSLHQRPTDMRCLKPQLDKVKATLGKLLGTVIADAGYGGEENYDYFENEQIEALVKYNMHHKEKSKKWQKDISRIDNWQYDEAVCLIPIKDFKSYNCKLEHHGIVGSHSQRGNCHDNACIESFFSHLKPKMFILKSLRVSMSLSVSWHPTLPITTTTGTRKNLTTAPR
jgi:hypothetical protein